MKETQLPNSSINIEVSHGRMPPEPVTNGGITGS
jgi:hypothetical protein